MEVKCVGFFRYQKGKLMGFADLSYKGIIFTECMVFMKDGNWWIKLPMRKYELNGETMYQKYIRFENDEEGKYFKIEARKAIKRYLNERKDNPFKSSALAHEMDECDELNSFEYQYTRKLD